MAVERTERPAAGRMRYGRSAALVVSLSTTAVSALGAFGLIGSGISPAAAEPRPGAVLRAGEPRGASAASVAPEPERTDSGPAESSIEKRIHALPAAPPGSGEGRRVVFDQSEQRVWLVGRRGQTRRSYLVSGSIYDNLGPGTYEVYSRSEQAWGIDDSGEMKWFVRFTTGDNAAIGFHSIPTKDGEPLQSRSELGTATSHGCIRQAEPDARAMWRFAQIGDTVVVVA